MAMEKYFFEIPIFRCTSEQFVNEVKVDMQKRIAYYKSGNEDIADKLAAINYDYEKLARAGVEFPSYRYSELVGIIRLFAITGQIRGELYFINNKRISKGFKNKAWSLRGKKIFELRMRRSDTNKSIFERILKQVTKYQSKSKILSKRYIDMECFKTIGENIDFILLADQIK